MYITLSHLTKTFILSYFFLLILMALLLPLPSPLDLPIQGPRGSWTGSYAPWYKNITIDTPYYGFWCIETISGGIFVKQ